MSIVLEPPLSQPAAEPTVPVAAKTKSAVRHDTLAESVVALLVLAVLQRGIGFVRGILVCRWLSPDELGQWDLAFSFLTLAAPLAVLGLPGSFGRYVEHFRQRGMLPMLLRRTAAVCAALTVVTVAVIAMAAPQISLLVFGRADQAHLVLALAASLAAVVVFNFVTELLTALRMGRAMSVLQFLNSLLFATMSITLLLFWKSEAVAMVVAYGLACLLVFVVAAWVLARNWQNGSPLAPRGACCWWNEQSAAKQSAFWSRLLPFAAWVWVTNLLFNLFEVVDRWMIVHFSTTIDPLAMVGDYHSSRVVPLLLVSVATMVSTITLPHLSCDWEAGRRAEVARRLNLSIKLLALLLFVGSITILLAAPVLFDVVLRGKFSGGRQVLPWTLTYCAWLGLTTMAQTYLWCAERARLGCVALGVGLVINVGLNLLLLPHYGLLGAVLATAAANAVALGIIFLFDARLGMRVDQSTLIVALLPVTIGFGLWVALVGLMATAVVAIKTTWIFTESEKEKLLGSVRQGVARFWRVSLSVD
ncbi:MAG: lipopolysaccharide biosynthesis protein [Pirellulales bacterium]|nr:lipopolysaccharide biosynthesis protein [Pirellulales bacterium]